jgi:hypothetical protein
MAYRAAAIDRLWPDMERARAIRASRSFLQTLRNVRETEPIDADTLLVMSVSVMFE